MYCNAENKKCEWIDRKDATGNDDSVCKRKTELKTFIKKPLPQKKLKVKASATDGAASASADGVNPAAPKAKWGKKEKNSPAEGSEKPATPKKGVSFGFSKKKPVTDAQPSG